MTTSSLMRSQSEGLSRLARSAWRAWKRIGQLIADQIARAILTVFYLTVFVPYGTVIGLRARANRNQSRGSTLWVERGHQAATLAAAGKLH